MKIETKYKIGQRIWVVYEHIGEACVYDTYIEEITIDKDGMMYITSEWNDFVEEEIVPYEDEKTLIEKIKKIMENSKDL